MIGLFLRGAAKSSYRQIVARNLLSGLTVERFMTPNPVTVPPGITLQDFVENYLYRYHYQIYPVVKDGELAGCVTASRLKDVPRDEWSHRLVGDVAASCEEATVVSPDMDAMDALGIMNRTGNSRLAVVENGRLVGIVTLKDLMELLALRVEMEGPKKK
jgi:CBS domain-containing protein